MPKSANSSSWEVWCQWCNCFESSCVHCYLSAVHFELTVCVSHSSRVVQCWWLPEFSPWRYFRYAISPFISQELPLFDWILLLNPYYAWIFSEQQQFFQDSAFLVWLFDDRVSVWIVTKCTLLTLCVMTRILPFLFLMVWFFVSGYYIYKPFFVTYLCFIMYHVWFFWLNNGSLCFNFMLVSTILMEFIAVLLFSLGKWF